MWLRRLRWWLRAFTVKGGERELYRRNGWDWVEPR